MHKQTLALVAASLLATSLSVQSQQTPSSFDDITRQACTTYKDSLVNMVRQIKSGTSPDATQQRGEARISDTQQNRVINQILDETLASESNPALKAEIQRANDAYRRGGQIKDFERGLSGFVSTCVKQKSSQVQRNYQEGQQAIDQLNRQQAPQSPRSNNQKRNSNQPLPSRDSYL